MFLELKSSFLSDERTLLQATVWSPWCPWWVGGYKRSSVLITIFHPHSWSEVWAWWIILNLWLTGKPRVAVKHSKRKHIQQLCEGPWNAHFKCPYRMIKTHLFLIIIWHIMAHIYQMAGKLSSTHAVFWIVGCLCLCLSSSSRFASQAYTNLLHWRQLRQDTQAVHQRAEIQPPHRRMGGTISYLIIKVPACEKAFLHSYMSSNVIMRFVF